MFEKVNPDHPDKQADRIAGALIDLAYSLDPAPRAAIEVLLGHGHCVIINETTTPLHRADVVKTVHRIAGTPCPEVNYREYPQDRHLAGNQQAAPRCGDNGIFRGTPITVEQADLTAMARRIHNAWRRDGKYLVGHDDRIIICQSGPGVTVDLTTRYPDAIANPLGDWEGGPDSDTGATNRKLGSDMGDAITGGGLHGKDLTKADVTLNICAHLEAQATGEPVEYSCAIGDTHIDGRPYSDYMEQAGEWIHEIGGFEALAEWGLIR